jgi:synaptic vesicle membrane protein VAT-1
MSAEEVAVIPVNYLTAWQLIVVMGGLKPNETVLIHSAGGGVGIAATQLAKHIGAKVIGTASTAKHGELRALGVDHLIDYRTEDFEARAREITGGRGVELILDPIGGDSLKKGYRLLAPTGLSPYLARRRRPRARREGCSACCPLSRARPGFSSIRCH